jgi:hypothetical protein
VLILAVPCAITLELISSSMFSLDFVKLSSAKLEQVCMFSKPSYARLLLFLMSRINPQVQGYTIVAFYPEVFRVSLFIFSQRMEVV